ncbi:Late embryogenesis abundant protein 76 [Pseudocercospora fuligena]|uniref:Late embryogenesis abundant protein 76 n=1 Tax=Pseudocercospora fuligena TaxID=685502 RepID=A0A8H6RVJ6_9PEZI|nr:Late embryogenesis abundant protein 76 [Pseudocercospora fuligena]
MSSSNQNEETAPFVQANKPEPVESVKDSTPSTQSITGTVQDTAEQIRQQIPSTESVAQQLPSAQDATETVKQGVNSLAAGLGNLINMATITTAPKVSTGEKPQDPEDLHVPGGFDDSEDLATASTPAEPTQSSQQKSVQMQSQAEPQRIQDANLEGTQPARPGVSDSASAIISSLPGATNTVPDEPVIGERQEMKYNLEDDMQPSTAAGSALNRVSGDELQSLPKSEQDVNLAETAAARPGADMESGVTRDAPVGVSSSSTGASGLGASALGSSNQTIGEQLAGGAEYVKQAAQNAGQAAYEQLPSAQTVKETAQDNAQYVANQLPSQAQVQETARSAGQTAYDQLPSAQAVKDTAQNGAQYVSEQMPSQETVQKSTENAYNQLPSAQAVKENAQSGAQYTKEAAQNAAQYASETAQSGSQLASEQLGTAPALPADSRTRTMQAVADEVMTGDSSYENRPQTLPQADISEREKERGGLNSDVGAPERVIASHQAAHSGLEAAGSAEAVHEKSEVERELLQNVAPAPATAEAISAGDGIKSSVPASGAGTSVVGNWGAEGASATTTTGVTPGSGYPAVGTSQQSDSVLGHGGIPAGGVHNGVIGHGSGELQPSAVPSAAESEFSASRAADDIAQRLNIAEPDLTAGVHNGMVGAGSRNGP